MKRRYKRGDNFEVLTKRKYLDRWKKYYYEKHEFHLSRNRKYYLERMFEWYDWFKSMEILSCSKCGFDKHPKALDFHHTNPENKLFDIGKFINGRQCNEENKKIIKEEIDKCIVLCSNCHRIYHFFKSNGEVDVI
jgi:hypothetical protein